MRTFQFCFVALVVLVAVSATSAQEGTAPVPRVHTFGTLGVALRADLTIYQGGARDALGAQVLTTGDRLLAWDGVALQTRDDFCRALYATRPGQEVKITFERVDNETRAASTLSTTIKLGDRNTAYADLYAHKDKRKRDLDWRNQLKREGVLLERLQKEIAEAKLEAQWDNLIAAHERELDLWDCFESTSACEVLLREPLAAAAFLRQATADFEQFGSREEGVSTALAALAKLADRLVQPAELPPLPVAEAPKLPDFGARAVVLLSSLAIAGKPADEAQARRDAELFAAALEFEFAWAGQEGHQRCVSLVHQLRQSGIQPHAPLAVIEPVLKQLMQDGREFWRLVQEGKLPAAPEGVDTGKFVEGEAACFRSSFGLVAVGGAGRNVWQGGPDAPAVILDLGGDDEYIDCATTAFTPRGPRTSIVIDVSGNDRYRATGKWGVAAGVMGVAVIHDLQGNDTYECSSWGIGAALGGVGLVLDSGGDDRYLGGRNTIGCAAYGFGGVLDLAGNDVYDAHEYGIGVGHPGGVGFVYDQQGDDRYRCNGTVPSGYGTKGEYSGWGIGCGFGWRGLAAGGVGLVVDGSGNDIYDVGEFGLGCGYFLGVGVVRDMGGDDIYHSSRYGLAAAAHCAAGLFMDDGGNDYYEGKTAASLAGVWDIATGLFFEGGGNDIYRCDGLALGGASQNAVAVFWEAGGDDIYRSAASSLGHGGAAEYGGGRLARNFGLFVDCGGKDHYPQPGMADHKKFWVGDHGLFADD